MIPYLKQNKLLAVALTVAVIVLVVASGFLAMTLRNSKSNTEDPSVQNDQRILQEQETRMTTQPTIPTSTTPENQNGSGGQGDLGDVNSTDPVQVGKALSGGNCSGTGSKPLTYAPMKTEQMSVIIPYGLMAAGHVTPIDHQYYWGKDQMGNADMYDVLAPADGTIVELDYRDRSQENAKVKGDYRGVISYSCTFFTYFDLATSLSPEITAKLDKGWESKQVIHTNIPVKAGQVIGKVGGQSLDFAVWDTTVTLKNLLVPVAYNNKEPWKIHTAPPLKYFSESVKAKILPRYANQSLKTDGTIDQDVDGSAAGNWFLEGTNGYVKISAYGTPEESTPYYSSHLSFAHDHVDPNGWVFSSGDVNGQPQQFAIKNPSVLPDALKPGAAPTKYEIAQWNHADDKGTSWVGRGPAASIMMVPGISKGTVLVQMLEGRKVKVEVFLNKTLSQVSGFTANAKLYTRGDGARMLMSNTAY